MSVLLLGNYLTLEIQLKSPKNKTRRGFPQIGGIMTAAGNATCWRFLCFYIQEIGPVSGSPGSTLSIVSCCPLFHFLLVRRAVEHPGSNLNCTTSYTCNFAESSLYLSKPWFLAQHHASLICSSSLGFPFGIGSHFHLNWERQSVTTPLTKNWCLFLDLPFTRFPISCCSDWN